MWAPVVAELAAAGADVGFVAVIAVLVIVAVIVGAIGSTVDFAAYRMLMVVFVVVKLTSLYFKNHVEFLRWGANRGGKDGIKAID